MSRPGICLALLLICASPLLAAEYWVAPNGDDANPGSQQRPFCTVGKAADVMRAGDTCTVRAGTYREAVKLRHSGADGKPIRFAAATGEKVTFDGTDPVAGPWKKFRGNIYSTAVKGPVEQVFVDGVMQIEARWPNMRLEEIWDRTKWARSDHGSQKDRMICEALAETGIDWTGALATLNVGHQYKTWTREVTKHSKGSDEFTYTLGERMGDGRDDGPTWADDCFYLSGKLEALDAPTEWYHDAMTGTLYLWCEDGESPQSRRVVVKRRTYAFDASKCDYLEIVNFRFYAATLRLNQCNHCLIDGCRLRYPVFARRFEWRTPDGKHVPEPETLIAGDGNTVRNTSVVMSNVGGIVVQGQHCRVENCIVHDVNWGGNISHPGISIRGRSDVDNHNVVSRCTVYNVGNIGIRYGGRANTIEYNHVFNTGRACKDIAAIHTGGSRAFGSVAHHNWVHGSTGLGMRGDDQTRGLTFHHNVVWNCHRGMIMKGNQNKVYNNTVLVDPRDPKGGTSIVIPKRAEPKKWWTKDPTLAVQNEETLAVNNASYLLGDRGGNPIPASKLVSNNVTLPRDGDVFVNASPKALTDGTFDLRPAPGSPLIDAGRVVPSVTEKHHGKAPDAGAYEAGGKRWGAGADWKPEPLGLEFIIRLEHASSHHKIPMPKMLHEAGISSKGLRKLQKLHDQLWSEGDRAATRKKAAGLRGQHPKKSPEYKKYHSTVVELHREVWMQLRERSVEILDEADLAAFKKAAGVK